MRRVRGKLFLLVTAVLSLVFGQLSFAMPALAANPDPNAAYFKGKSQLPDPATIGDLDVLRAYEDLATSPSAVVLTEAQANAVVQALKTSQLDLKKAYLEYQADIGKLTTPKPDITTAKDQALGNGQVEAVLNNKFFRALNGQIMLTDVSASGVADTIQNNLLVYFGAGPIGAYIAQKGKDFGADINTGLTLYENTKTVEGQIQADLTNIHYYTYILYSNKSANAADGKWRPQLDQFGNEYGIDSLYYSAASQNPKVGSDGKLAYNEDANDPTIPSLKAGDTQGKGLRSLHDFIAEFGPIELGGVNQSDDIKNLAAIGDASQGLNDQQDAGTSNVRCGSALAALNPFQSLRYGICSFVTYGNQLIDSFLVSSVSLLGVTSGIYGNFNASQAVNPSNFTVDGWNKTPITLDQNSFFGDILPTSVSTPFQQVMVDTNTSIGRVVVDTTNLVTRVLNALMIIVFIFIALANILQINVSTYNIRKLLPGLIIGYVLAFASPFLIRAGLEVVSRVGEGVFEISRSIVTSDSTTAAITTQNDFQYFASAISNVRGVNGALCFTDDESGQPRTNGNCGNAFEGLTSGLVGQAGINDSRVFQQAVLGIAVAVGAVLIFVLGFLLMFRVFVFAILVPLAPLAVFARFFPPLTKSVWDRWWGTMSKWILMPIPVMVCLILSFIYFAAANEPTSAGQGGGADQGLLAAIINYAAAVGFLFAAIKLPFSMAGEAKSYLDKWNALGRWGWNQTGGAAITAAGYGSLKNNVLPALKDRFKARNEGLYSSPANRLGIRYAEALSENTKLKQDRTKLAQEGAKLQGQGDARGNDRYRDAKGKLVQAEERNGLAKGKLEADEGRLKAEAKAKVREDLAFAKLEAEVEAIKETTGVLDETLKSEIKARKNNLLAAKEAGDEGFQLAEDYRKARVTQIEQNFEAEKADRSRVEAWNQHIKGNPGLLDKMLEAEVYKGLREKAEKKPLGDRAEVRMKVSILEDQIAKLNGDNADGIDDPDKAAQIRRLIARIAAVDGKRAEQLQNPDGSFNRDPETGLGRLNTAFLKDDLRGKLNKGIYGQVGGKWADDLKEARESGSYYGDLFEPKPEDGNENTALFRYLGDETDQLSVDQAKALAAMAGDINKGEASDEVVVKRAQVLDSLHSLGDIADDAQREAAITQLATDAHVDVETVRKASQRVRATDPNRAYMKHRNDYTSSTDPKDKAKATTTYSKEVLDKVAVGIDRSVAAGSAKVMFTPKDTSGVEERQANRQARQEELQRNIEERTARADEDFRRRFDAGEIGEFGAGAPSYEEQRKKHIDQWLKDNPA